MGWTMLASQLADLGAWFSGAAGSVVEGTPGVAAGASRRRSPLKIDFLSIVLNHYYLKYGCMRPKGLLVEPHHLLGLARAVIGMDVTVSDADTVEAGLDETEEDLVT